MLESNEVTDMDSVDPTSESLRLLIGEFSSLCNSSWGDFRGKVEAITEGMKEDDFRAICTKRELFDKAFFSGSRGHWVSKRVLEELLPMFPELGERLVWESEIEDVKEVVLSAGIYRDIAILNKVALVGSGASQVIAAKNCDIKTLRELKGHKNFKIRKIYFERLGAVECLDEMLDDKIAAIRVEGIDRAPYFYDRLKGLVGEIARGPFHQLIDKIPSDYLPMLLANRNIKDSWIAAKIEIRLNRG